MEKSINKAQEIATDAHYILYLLGRNANEVAATLLAEDIKGIKGSATHCPIAIWLQRHLNIHDQYATVVSSYRIAICGGDNWCEAEIPQAVSRFIEHFDEGWYPYLEEKDATNNDY